MKIKWLILSFLSIYLAKLNNYKTYVLFLNQMHPFKGVCLIYVPVETLRGIFQIDDITITSEKYVCSSLQLTKYFLYLSTLNELKLGFDSLKSIKQKGNVEILKSKTAPPHPNKPPLKKKIKTNKLFECRGFPWWCSG